MALCLFLAACASPSSSSSGSGDSATAYAASQIFVQERLKSPATADFPRMSEIKITSHGNGRYSVVAWVFSENSFGAMLRTDYVAEVDVSTDDWKLISLDFLE
jgi:hypothetical protein